MSQPEHHDPLGGGPAAPEGTPTTGTHRPREDAAQARLDPGAARTPEAPDPDPADTPGLQAGGSVDPGDTPPSEGGTSGLSAPEAKLPSRRVNAVIAASVVGVVILVVLLFFVFRI